MASDPPSGPLTLRALADHLGGRLVGARRPDGRPDARRTVTGIAPTPRAGPDDVTVLTDPRYRAALTASRAAAVILGPDDLSAPRPATMAAIVVDDPYGGFARAAQALLPPPPRPAIGVHPTAVIDPSAALGQRVAVGPLVYLGPSATVGDDAVLHAGAHVEAGASVGAGTVLYNHVVVRHGCRVGARCILHPGVIIGGDGFGFARAEGRTPLKIPQVGGVVVEDDVEIGANSTIDRGTFDDTRIGRGAKLDNLVMAGHNVEIGPGAVLVAQSGVAGSSVLEAGVVMGAQSGVSGRVRVGAGATVYGQAGVIRDVPPGVTVAGTPAEPKTEFFRALLRLRKLDGWVERVRELERAVSALTNGHDQTQS